MDLSPFRVQTPGEMTIRARTVTYGYGGAVHSDWAGLTFTLAAANVAPVVASLALLDAKRG